MSTSMDRTDPVAGLATFRRYTWWSLVGSVFLMLFIPGAVWWGALPDGVPSWADGIRWGLPFVIAGASVPLVEGLLPDRSGGTAAIVSGEPPRVASAVAAVAAGAHGLFLLAMGEYRVWVTAPIVVLTLLMSYRDRSERIRWSAGAVVVGVTATLVVSVVATGSPDVDAAALSTVVILFVLSVTLGQMWTWEVLARLDDARRTAARLAVADERLRFAADLHDIQGHHLQAIALKAELAARLVASDPEASAERLREVQRIAIDALRDTRAVVHGYRRTSLDAELANATAVLAAADIDGRTHLDPAVDVEALPADTRHLFGMVVREAMTNVLRHSDAANAELELSKAGDRLRLVVTNDGVIGDGEVEVGGLAALEHRLRSADGALLWSRAGDRFVLEASLPDTAVLEEPV